MTHRYLVSLTFLIAACGDAGSNTGTYAVQSAEQDAVAASIDCGCFWQSYAYGSEAACRADRAPLFSDAQQSCVERAGDSFPEFEEIGACQLAATTAKLGCYSDYQDSCNPDGFDACDAAEEAADAACEALDPCVGLAGSALTACEAERSQLVSAILDCF